MKDIVLIPCWRRADFLSVTLEHISAAKNNDHYYIFLLDRNFSEEMTMVISRFPLEHEVRYASNHRYHGNSYNVLEGYKYAFNRGRQSNTDLIYLIEEDIWIAKDFFTFHKTIQTNFNSFAVSAVRCHVDEQVIGSPNQIYCKDHYQSLGVSWTLNNLHSVIKHANPRYYSNMSKYCKSVFKRSKLGSTWTEQDGLICRVREQTGCGVIYPYKPRAYHAGYVGYNRPGQAVDGSLGERIERLKTMNQEEMNNRASVYKDIEQCDLNGYDVETFEFRSI